MLRPAVGLARRSARASFALRRNMSMAAPAQLQQYRSNAEDKLLSHLARVAAATQAEGKLEQSGELYAHLVNARRERHGDRHPLTVHAIGALSLVHKELGDFSSAEGLAREAASASEDTLGKMHPESLRMLSNLASVLTGGGKLDEAEATARVVVDGYRSVFGDGHEEVVSAESHLGEVLDAQGKMAAA